MMIDTQTEEKIDAFFSKRRHRVKAHIPADHAINRRFVMDMTPPILHLRQNLPTNGNMQSAQEIQYVRRALVKALKEIDMGHFPVYDAHTRAKIGSLSVDQFLWKCGSVSTEEQIRKEMEMMDS